MRIPLHHVERFVPGKVHHVIQRNAHLNKARRKRMAQIVEANIVEIEVAAGRNIRLVILGACHVFRPLRQWHDFGL